MDWRGFEVVGSTETLLLMLCGAFARPAEQEKAKDLGAGIC